MVYNPVNSGDALSSSVGDINDAFDNLARWFSGTSAPSSPEALMRWFNTSDSILYVRNTSNTAWVPCKLLDSETGFIVSDGSEKITVCAPPGLSTDYVIKLPTAQGGSLTFLRNDGSGNLSWVAGGASGVTELNGLSDVTISGAASGQYLRRGASVWGNVAGVDIADLVVGSVAQGDVIVRGASGWERLGVGTNGQFLTTNGTSVSWGAGGGGGGSTTLDGLTDTNITSVATGDFLKWDGSDWANQAGILVGDLTVGSEARGDVIIRGASGWTRLAVGSSGQVLTSDGTDVSWGAGGGGGSTTLDGLDDTNITSVATGDFLKWDGSDWANQAGILVGDLTVASEARGDVIIRGASGWVRLPVGGSGTFLRSNGTDPSWTSPTLSGLSDTTIVGAVTGEYLRYTSGSWQDSVLLMSDLFEASSTTGDLAYHDGTNWSRLARGSTGQVLKATAGSIEWAAESGGGGSTTIDGLDDTNITSVATGDFLKWDGSDWANQAGILVGDLTVGSQARGDIITRGASAWGRLALGATGAFLRSNGTDAVWAVPTLAALSDTTIIGAVTGEYLRYTSGSWQDSVLLMSDLFEASSTTGDLAYHDGTNWSRLARGTTGQILKATAGSIEWAAESGGGGSTTLDGLDDTNITSVATGDFLKWDGSDWANQAGILVGDLTVGSEARGDVIIRGASGWIRLGIGTNGQVLKSDGTDVGWASGGEVSGLTDLSDVTLTSATSGDYLKHTGSVFENVSGVGIADLTVGSQARGDIITRGASSWGRLALGATNAVLGSDGTDAVWVASTGTGSIARAASPTFTGTVGVANLSATGNFSSKSFSLESIITGGEFFDIIFGSTTDSYSWIIPSEGTLPSSGTYYLKISSNGTISYSAT